MSWFQAAQIGLGLLGLGQASRQDRAAEERANKNEYLNSPAGIRAEAEKAGFNPLVFTNQVGGFGSQLGFSGSTANAIQTLSSTFGDIVNQDMRKQEIELENKRLQELVKKSMVTANSNKVTYDTKLPSTNKENAFEPVNVYDPQGNKKNIPLSIANRLGMVEGDIFMVEDWEALVGEIGAEVQGANQLAEQLLEPIVRDGHIGDRNTKPPKPKPNDAPIMLDEIVITPKDRERPYTDPARYQDFMLQR